jgi:hypothetical protein
MKQGSETLITRSWLSKETRPPLYGLNHINGAKNGNRPEPESFDRTRKSFIL